jgi:RimJ/RimL family protein N-acetyltransferase
VLLPLVAADADDLAELRELLGSATVDELRARFLGWERRRSPDGRQAWLNWTLRLRADGRAVGWVQATVTGDSAEIAYATLAAARRRGFAAEAVRAMVAWLGASRVEAHIDPGNRASAALARSLGFRATDAVHEGEVVWAREMIPA